MSQVIITPQAFYKWFRNMVQGHTGSGVEADGFYIDKGIGAPGNAVKKITYFKVGTGAPTVGGNPSAPTDELTRSFYDSSVKDNNGGKGDLASPIAIYATDPEGYDSGVGPKKQKKGLNASNFYTYGNSPDSKVIGILGAVADGSGKYFDIPGVAFQVGCHLTTAEGNFSDGAGASPVFSPAVVNINEIGLFDDDDHLLLYGIFAKQPKNEQLTLKVNVVAMAKTLDFQLVLTPTTTTSTSSTTSTSTTLTTTSSTSSSTTTTP